MVPYRSRHSSVVRPEIPGFEVGDLLGEGATGQVWAAIDLATDEPRAVKILRGSGCLAAAEAEFALLRGHDLPHVVRVHALLPLGLDEAAIVMDLHRAGSLHHLVASRGHLTPGEVVTALSPLASTLGRLHAAGVIHADIAPGNVLFGACGRPVLADLGVCRIVGVGPRPRHGTTGFLAPEILAGGVCTPAGDVYAMAAVAWFALTGAAPEPGVLRRSLREEVPPALSAHPLLAVVEEALSSDPSRRPSADGLAVALFDAAPAEPLTLVEPGTDAVAVLTQRLREAAVALTDDTTSAGPRLRSPRGPLRAPYAAWLARAPRLRLGPGGRRVALILVASIVAAVAGFLTSSLWVQGRAEAAGPPGTGPITSVGSPAAPDPLREERIADPRGLAQALADARAGVWSTGLVSALGALDAPDSPALRADTAAVAPLQRAGEHYEGLTLTVRSATLVSQSGTTAELAVVVDSSGYLVVGADRRERKPAVPGASVVLVLRWTQDGWRVYDVAGAPSRS